MEFKVLSIVVAALSVSIINCEEITSVSSVSPRYASLAGHTLITITGRGFAQNLFNHGDGNENLGNVVLFVSDTRSYECDIHKDGCHETQIMCFTRPMVNGRYYARVSVDGVSVPVEEHCKWEFDYSCALVVSKDATPTIISVEPSSGPPGTILTISGKILTSSYFPTETEGTNGRSEKLRRVYVGNQACEMRKNEITDELYGIELNNDGRSDDGWFKCKLMGDYVGNTNVSFIVDGPYGRSEPEISTYRVSNNNKVYMFQSYAVIEDVNPKTGSLEGGTELHISGNYFDTIHPAVVKVGDEPCEVLSVTIDEIVCRTAAKPENQTSFGGNRGIQVYHWYDGSVPYSDLPQVTNYSSNGSNTYLADEAMFLDKSSYDNFRSRFKGFFTPPMTTKYEFVLLADDLGQVYFSESDQADDKELIIYCESYCQHQDTKDSQTSRRFSLQKGKRYYYEVLHAEFGYDAYIKFGMKVFQTSLIQSASGQVENEVQIIEIDSTKIPERQSISFKDWEVQTSVSEQQRITVVMTNGSDSSQADIQFQFAGANTKTIPFVSSAKEIQTALNDLMSFFAETVTVEKDAEDILLTFPAEMGDVDDIVVLMLPPGVASVTVTEEVKGVADLANVHLTLGGVPSSPIAYDATAEELEDALWEIFTWRCPSTIVSAGEDADLDAGRKLHFGFEPEETLPSYIWGTIAFDTDPFCGRGSLRKPRYLYSGHLSPLKLYLYPKMCFAYKGRFQNGLSIRHLWTNSEDEERSRWNYIHVDFVSDGRWHYTCLDLLALVEPVINGPFTKNKLKDLIIIPEDDNSFVDELVYAVADTIPNKEWSDIGQQILSPPMGTRMEDISVKKSNDSGVYEVKLEPYGCAHDFPHFGILGAQMMSNVKDLAVHRNNMWTSNSSLDVEKTESASKPVLGTFELMFKDQVLEDIPANVEPERLESLLRSLDGMGHVNVLRSGSCDNYKWTIQWVDIGGDQPLTVLNGTNLEGNEVSIDTWSKVDGGIYYEAIPGEFLQTYEEQPQVVVTINKIPSACHGNCSFNWEDEQTPTVTAINPTSGSLSAGTSLTITGTGLETTAEALDTSVVSIGDVVCDITSSSDTELQCDVGEGPLGAYDVEVTVGGKGLAAHDSSRKQFTYTGTITSISPKEGSNAGGLPLYINGSGFSNQSTVSVGGKSCPILNFTYTTISCRLPPKPKSKTTTMSVVVNHPEGRLTSGDNFVYKRSLTPLVDSINVTSSKVTGGGVMLIVGRNLEPAADHLLSVSVDTAPARIVSESNTEVTVILPPHRPGAHDVLLRRSDVGLADTPASIPQIDYTLSVDAVMPARGSLVGGSSLTLQGDGFPDSLDDSEVLSVTVAEATCDIESVSTDQIVCVLDSPGRNHDITNLGNHPDYGRGYAWKPPILEVMTGDTVTWRWVTPVGVRYIQYAVMQVDGASERANVTEGGFNSGEKTPTGSFAKTFDVPGKYYYTSGTVDKNGNVELKGVVKVMPRMSSVEMISVQMAGFEAEYNIDSGETITPSAACHGNETEVPSCQDKEINDHSSAGHFNFTFSDCLTPTIQKVEPRELFVNEVITITGTGFSKHACENKVMIGDARCIVDRSTDTSLSCHMDLSDAPAVYTRSPVSLTVDHRGHGLWTTEDMMERTVVFNPYFDTVSPVRGSLAGGTSVTIIGAGFPEDMPDDLEVEFGSSECLVKTATYTDIVCETDSGDEGIAIAMVSLQIDGFANELDCTNNTSCSFEYSSAVTTIVDNVYPGRLTGFSNTLTLEGGFSSITEDSVSIAIGPNACDIMTKNDTVITCGVTNLVSGYHAFSVSIDPHGLANMTIGNRLRIPVSGDIDSITPAVGSINGGTKVTITGWVFDPDSATVEIGGSDCAVLSVDYGNITCMTTAHSEEVVDVKVLSSIATIWGSNLYDYTESSTPTVTSITPESASASGSLSLVGTGFSLTSGENEVSIGGHSCLTSRATSVLLVCGYGDLPAGVYSIGVEVAGVGIATVNNVQFQYNPTVTVINPDSGSFGGGHLVTVSGSGFDATEGATSVLICDEPCDIVNINLTDIQCLTAANSGQQNVDCDAVVSVNNLDATKSAAYTYDLDKTPVILGVSPTRGGTGGGTRVTINGTDFGNDPSALSVTIADIVCDVDPSDTTSTLVVCVTNSIPLTTKTKVSLQVGGRGIASQQNADFEYIDQWSSPFTWGGESLPIEGDLVVIRENQTVLLDTDTPILKMLLIQGGSLIFDRKDVELNAEYILVTNGGLFQVGTEEEPFMENAVIKLHGHWRTPELPLFGSKVLGVREGTLDLHGRPTPVTWTRLQNTAAAGAREIELKNPVTWQSGDEIVLASTGNKFSQRETEVRKILSVSPDGRTLTLNDSLQYEHISITETFAGEEITLSGEVAVLSRNVKVQGSNDARHHQKIEACEEGFNPAEFATQTCFQGRAGAETDSSEMGAQIFLHTPKPDTGTLTARIENVEITFAGQRSRLGRYPIHYHLLGHINGSYVKRCAIHNTFNRAINVHATHNALLEHNVAYKVLGGAFFLEDGIETKNTIQYNLGVSVFSSSSLRNADITPATFWITHADNNVNHNAAAGGSHFGFWYQFFKHPEGPSFTTDICRRNIPLLEFKNNTAHSFGRFGLWIFPHYHPQKGGSCGGNQPETAVFEDFTAWNCDKGAEWVDCSDTQFEGFKMLNNDHAGIEMKMNKGNRKFSQDGGVIRDSIIVGHSSASQPNDITAQGIVLPFDSGVIIENTKFVNFDRGAGHCLGVASIDGTCSNICGGWHYQTNNLTFKNAPNQVGWRWEHEGWIEDLDGTLTGTAGERVVPASNLLPQDQCQEVAAFSHGPHKGHRCSKTVSFLRFAFNNINPPSLRFKNVLLENSNGISSVPNAFKRLTHKEGWMALLPSGDTFKMEFENAPQIVNISYTGVIYELMEGESAIIRKNVTEVPDIVRIKPGSTRKMSEEALSPKNNNDGDWYFDPLTNNVEYMVAHNSEKRKKRSGVGPTLINSEVQIQMNKCFYENCIVPGDPNTKPPVDERPDVFYLWSDANTWLLLQQDKPRRGDSVLITRGVFVVVDEQIPELDELIIEGALEFEYLPQTLDSDDYYDFTLSANYIFIKGGRLIMGWPDKPFRGQGDIILRGSHSSPTFRYPNGEEGPAPGAKALGVFGGLDLHGIPHEVQWTHLSQTAVAGSRQIILDEPVDWEVDSEIVITSTSYEPWETETFRIVGKSGDSYTLTLNTTLQYKHLGEIYDIPGRDSESDSVAEYKMAAQVGLLSHNIRIRGGGYSNLFKESFGARVLVGAIADEENEFIGYARLNDVEFVHTGQEGFTATYDPRFSLAFLGVGHVNEIRPSFVENCSFHTGFATAIGVFGTNSLEIKNNVIHRTVNHGMHIQGSGNMLTHNLITLVIWPGSYNGRTEASNFDQTAGIEATEAMELTMTDNVVAGVERIGYMLPGEPCDNGPSLFSNNKAQAVLTGVGIFPDYALRADCILLNGFTIQKAFDYGFYLQALPSMELTNNFLVDNGLSVFTMPLGPPATSHRKSDKFVNIEDNVIIGSSPDFDCNTDVMAVDNHILRFSKQARSFRTKSGGKIGISFPSFQSAGNEAPRKPWTNIMAYPTISGIMTVKNTHVASFKANACGERSAVVSTNKNNDDGLHPVELEGITQGDVEQNSKAFLHRPNVGKINPSDCVDMDCDGLKKALLKDIDGSFLGTAGAVIPQSEWEWNGDPRRGLGDFRIPKVMLTDLDGGKIEVDSFAPNKGIIRNSDCEYIDDWQAYWCPERNYEMLIIESLDHDTETRRLSPVAIVGDGYLDLINGPQDHGWCFGYTCQERISTFMALVETGKHYDIYLSSTNPQVTRFYLLNTDADQAVTLAVYYANPQRLDVYKNMVYMYPTNSDLDENGEIVYSDTETLPTVADISGTNYFDSEMMEQHITLKGPDPVDIIISPVVVIAFNVPPLTIDEFFGDNLVSNLAAFLGIDKSRIKSVNIVREESRRRREGEATVEVVISEKPVMELDNETVAIEVIRDAMINITSVIVTEIQLGRLRDILNITLLGASVLEAMPAPGDPAWEIYSQSLSEGTLTLTSIKIPSIMEMAENVSQGVEGAGFDIAPALRVLDALGELVTILGSTGSPWQVSVSLISESGTDNRALLIGTERKGFQFGYANFTDLAITHSGTGYMLEFTVILPTEASFLSLTAGPFTVTSRVLSARAVDLQLVVSQGEDWDITLEVIDAWSVVRAHDISWKGHTWACTVEKYEKTGYQGEYSVLERTVSINESGLVTFSNLSLSDDGDVAFTFDCVTTPDSEYSFTVYSDVVSVMPEVMPRIDKTHLVSFTIEEDFSEVVGEELQFFRASMKNFLRRRFQSEKIHFDNVTATQGSIIVTFTLSGETIEVDETIEALWVELEDGMVLTYGDRSMQAEPYMTVDGEERRPADEDSDDESDGLHPAIIEVICVVAVAVIICVFLLILLKCTKSGRSLVVRMKGDGNSHVSVSGNGDVIITDQVPPRKALYNERSFRRLSPCTPSPDGFNHLPDKSPSWASDNQSTPGSANPLIEPNLRVYSPRAMRDKDGQYGGMGYEPQMKGKQVMMSNQGTVNSGYRSQPESPLPEPK